MENVFFLPISQKLPLRGQLQNVYLLAKHSGFSLFLKEKASTDAMTEKLVRLRGVEPLAF